MNAKILIVEDDERLRDVFLEATAMEMYLTQGVSTAEEAIERLRQEHFDIVITDVTLPGMSGLDLLPYLPRLRPGILAIVITAYGTINIAVEAMKRGATDFLTKPFELDTLLGTIRVAAERVMKTRAEAVAAAGSPSAPGTLIAVSPAMLQLLQQVRAVAPFPMTVLITGETGTGKEMIARAIHQLSPRREKPFVALNCAAVPEQLLEDELFGHVKGAFTGAHSGREGRFEQAANGTLFLDEIGDMSMALQTKLLRVLQEREFERLGSSQTIKVDVRVVAATSATLETRIEEGTFRADLYYRLNVVHLRLPPLRERREDIRPLAEHLLTKFCTATGLPRKSVSADAWTVLLKYRWPGNVRQLQNAMERAAAMSGVLTEIGLQDLPEEVREAASEESARASPAVASGAPQQPSPADIQDEAVNFDAVMTKVERDLLLQALDKTGGNKLRAAKLLNMKRTTLVEKLKRLQIDFEKEESDTQQE
ncbi:MAG TPA: sigma-54 dependent transcriptional regulator [Pyrinomonadaceae bacterium]|nr:sigma-54 dependent transcriptional regulator [Pyrinomonadaceae bacterium]